MVDKLGISVTNAIIGYNRKKPILAVKSFHINPGDIVAINGASGIGKTTLLRTLAGLIRPLHGEVSIFGNRKPRRGTVGYIPQRLGLLRHSSVYHNVLLGVLAGHTNPWFPYFSNSKLMIKSSLELVGISEKIWSPVRELSGGQQRRVAIARALVQNPKMILADEFLAELDDETLSKVMGVVLDFVKENNAIMILVEHNLERAKIMANRIFTAEDGTLFETELR
ncbi:MAG: phosphate ABC transporter ATP-binding protein [Euryarchaeota archaeon]|nr:phosphate ABC transporter ATP-binding protein [Euryarchaeota archaeon]DAC18987.1 MAG TPA: ATP-binding cassette domain-containing protein [Candidatus Poseidoniales archaeon]HII62144.1 ATP-binding cassette domain-containing protein [Candidatus Poseidoniaceae archaeon]|tara:strand:- start:144 stop:815 length:672 start_codon:yes stop_codon:yes gene_type:complete